MMDCKTNCLLITFSEQTGYPAQETGGSWSEECGLHGRQPPRGASTAPAQPAGTEAVRKHYTVQTGQATT